MKTKWHVYILWSVLSLGLLCCAADTSAFTRRKRGVSNLGNPRSKPVQVSATEFSLKLPASTSPLSKLSPPRRPPPLDPRAMRPAKIQSDFAAVPDVSVTCSTSDLVVRVKPAFYGLGAEAEELRLGHSCRSNGVLRPYGDLLFTYPLTACDAVREAPGGYLVYKFVLHYEPSPKRFPSTAHRIDVDIECRYQRNHHVYLLAVKPTWQTAVMRKKLKGRPSDFKIELMDDSWSAPARPHVYQLGQTVNVQVSALHLPSGGKLYISSCYATPSSGSKSYLKYTIIDNFGCMLDSKKDPGASQFIYRTDKTLQFSLKAFHFTPDPDTEVSIHCEFSVTSEDPSPTHKSCTYIGNRWKALTGDDSLCECCDSECVTSDPWKAMTEGSASSESLLVSDQPYAAEEGFLPISPSLVSVSREDKTPVSRQIDEQHSPEYVWESADVVEYDDYDEEEYTEEELGEVESRIIFGDTTEPESEKFIFRHGVLVEERSEAEVKNVDEPEDDGSAYDMEDVFEGEAEHEISEGREDETSDAQQTIHSNQREGEVLRHWAQEVQLPESEGEEEKRTYTGRDEEHDRTRAYDEERKNDDGLADVDDMTWYFTWR
ncbi:zona pellucida sperm-binding protein 3 [Hippoglossus hippoglossus]|uniref:zona pellucida sperm-binding protein 3 n=1 Tax=Hippoglossus hippoglossus TaxID=8267 RepID=UPI00148E74DF|nr:zona pellucida sperm-binding protein 3 [Hippoglossus hippoglossus]